MVDNSPNSKEVPERCLATTQKGAPCSAKPWRDGLCRWHHPDAAEMRRSWSVAGGRAKSNANRARKALLGDISDLAGVQASLLRALRRVEDGEIEPNVANSMANLARAIVALSSAVTFEQRLAEVEAALASGGGL